jgi:hypothetical protein
MAVPAERPHAPSQPRRPLMAVSAAAAAAAGLHQHSAASSRSGSPSNGPAAAGAAAHPCEALRLPPAPPLFKPPPTAPAPPALCCGAAVAVECADRAAPPAAAAAAAPAWPGSCCSPSLGQPGASHCSHAPTADTAPAVPATIAAPAARAAVPDCPVAAAAAAAAADDRAEALCDDGRGWQYALVTCPWLFKPCPSCCRAHAGREALMTYFNPARPAARGMCSHCPGRAAAPGAAAAAQPGGGLLQIRRSTYHEVVKISDLGRLADVAGIQHYVINGAKVVFLCPRPQPRPPKGVAAPSRCAVDGRQLMDASCRYCSLQVGRPEGSGGRVGRLVRAEASR